MSMASSEPLPGTRVIVDTSAWIEFLQASGSGADHYLVAATQEDGTIVVPEVVRMELLIGGTTEAWADKRSRLVARFDTAALHPGVDTEVAAAIHRACRRQGETVRSLIDCLVAAAALRLDLPVVHRDRDFEVMARHVDLRTVPLLGP